MQRMIKDMDVVTESSVAFSALGRKSFEFWNDKKDEIYQEFYEESSYET